MIQDSFILSGGYGDVNREEGYRQGLSITDL